MKLLFDLFPVILFFAAFKLGDIYLATGIAILASIAQIGWLKIARRPVEPMQWAGLVIIVVFGGLTLILRDETFIKWKPTVLYVSLAAALAVSRWVFGRNLIEKLMGAQIQLPPAIWSRINLAWVIFFASMGALNLWVAYTFSTDVWVNFKLFGTMGLTIAFVIAQALYMSRFAEDKAP
ncbi:MAG: septation protein A [Betaproteobacteria bacterium]|nr:septation protein A [Betaproteobacteria bacterium]